MAQFALLVTLNKSKLTADALAQTLGRVQHILAILILPACR